MPLPRRRSVAGLLAIGAIALVAGCGGGDDSLTAEEFRTQETPTTTAPATTAPATTAAPTTAASGDTAAYVADVQEAATALQEFGTVLQGSTGLDDLRASIPEAQAALDTFDAAIADLDGYTLDVPRLEEQRSGLAETGPAVSDVLRRFLDAAGEGDLTAVQELIPEVTRTIGEFQAAATG